MTYDPNNNIYTYSRPSKVKLPKHPCLVILLIIAFIVIGWLLLNALIVLVAYRQSTL